MSGVESHHARALELIGQGRHAQAEQLLRRVLQRSPNDLGANHLLASSLLAQGKAEQALFFSQRAAAQERVGASVFDVLGSICASLGRHDEAERAFRRAVEIDPGTASAWNGLCSTLMLMKRYDDAADAGSRAAALSPDDARIASNYAYALQRARGFEASRWVLERAVARWPKDFDLAVQSCSLLNYASDGAGGEELARHKALGALVEARARDEWPGGRVPEPQTTGPSEGRALRVGLLSADFRDHSVCRFVEPLLRACAGTRRDADAGLLVTCYADVDRPDDHTARLRALAHAWRDVFSKGDREVGEVIRKDRVDVLIDLAGWTAGTRLPVLAHRPAPLRVTWLGYPNTTGLPSVQARLVDSLTDPAESEALASERLVRLDPCFLCFEQPAGAPAARTPPSLVDGRVRFGSFNAALKVSSATVSLWSRVLLATPGSVFVLKSHQLEQTEIRRGLLDAFAAQGVDASRIEILGYAPSSASHLSMYERIDVALDPYPYHGTTTTCEALFMGVPVVTLAGRVHRSRVGVSLLTNAGASELIARDPDEYVRLATTLARDAARLSAYATTLREKMLASPLMHAPGFAQRFEAALRGLLT